MNCLLVADIHYSLKQFDWIQQTAARFDLVIIAGDLLDAASAVNKEAQIVVVLKYLRRLLPQTRLLVSSGNHDGNGAGEGDRHTARWLDKARDQGVLVDGDHFLDRNCLFTICQWRDGEATTERIQTQLEVDAERDKERWIWIYHEPPQGRPVSWTGKKHTGDECLNGWIETYQPDIVLSGHVHQAPFRQEGSWVDRMGQSWVFNMGRQLGPVPAFIVLDLERQQGTWLSQAGQEQVTLTRPLGPENPVELA